MKHFIKHALVSIFLIALVLVITCWLTRTDIRCGNSLRDVLDAHKQEIVYSHNSLYVFKEDDVYKVVVTEGDWRIAKMVSFTENREPVHSVNLELKELESMRAYNWFTGKSIDTVQSACGAFHANIGSGHECLAYVTTEGYLVTFTLFNGVVGEINIIDLFSGKVLA